MGVISFCEHSGFCSGGLKYCETAMVDTPSDPQNLPAMEDGRLSKYEVPSNHYSMAQQQNSCVPTKKTAIQSLFSFQASKRLSSTQTVKRSSSKETDGPVETGKGL